MARYGGGAEEPAALRVRLSPSYLSRPPPGPDAHDPSAPHRLNSYRDRAMSPYTRHTYVFEYLFSSFVNGHSPERLQ